MDVVQTPEGWVVMRNSEIVDGPFATNGEAWRALDRRTGDPVSRSEKTSEWLWQQQLDA